MKNATFFNQDAASLTPPISITEFIAQAKQYRDKTTCIVDGRLIDEFGRDITDKKPRSFIKGEPIRLAPHLYMAEDIVKEVQSKRGKSEDWSSPARVLDNMQSRLTQALEHLVIDFDYKNHTESNPAHTARILAETLLTLNDFFKKNSPKGSRSNNS